MKPDIQNGRKRVNVTVNLEKMFVIINNVGIKINADVNIKNQLIKECVITDLFGILVIVSVNVIKLVMLVNIQTIKIVSANSCKQTVLRQFFTCDFLIYKKNTCKPPKILPVPPNIPVTLFKLKNNYSYNHVKKV